MMSKLANAFVGRLKTAKQVIKISWFEKVSLGEYSSSFINLPFFYLNLLSAEKLAD